MDPAIIELKAAVTRKLEQISKDVQDVIRIQTRIQMMEKETNTPGGSSGRAEQREMPHNVSPNKRPRKTKSQEGTPRRNSLSSNFYVDRLVQPVFQPFNLGHGNGLNGHGNAAFSGSSHSDAKKRGE